MGKIVILAGIHGNEYGPSLEITDQILNNTFLTGIVNKNYVIYPRINIWGLFNNNRLDKDGNDLNRMWPRFPYEKSDSPIINNMLNDINNASLIIDFHEAWGFHDINKDSLGQTIYSNNKFIRQLIYTKVIPHMPKYKVIDKLPYVGGALDEYCNMISTNYILVEISGQDNPNTTIYNRRLYTRIFLKQLLKN